MNGENIKHHVTCWSVDNSTFHISFHNLDLPDLNGSHRKVVENMSKNDEKKLVWWSVLEVHHCKCNDKYYISMSSKRHLPVKNRISQTNSNFGYFAFVTIKISRL